MKAIRNGENINKIITKIDRYLLISTYELELVEQASSIIQDSVKRRNKKIVWLKKIRQAISKDCYAHKTDEELMELIKLYEKRKQYYIHSTLHWQNKKQEWINFNLSKIYFKEKRKDYDTKTKRDL